MEQECQCSADATGEPVAEPGAADADAPCRRPAGGRAARHGQEDGADGTRGRQPPRPDGARPGHPARRGHPAGQVRPAEGWHDCHLARRTTRPGRLPDLLPHVSVKRLVDWGADAVKILIYYSPFDDASVNDVKHAFLERIGAECEACEIPFFLEIVGYDPKGGDERSLQYARQKPEIVKKSMEVFSRPEFRVDVLKVEVPVNVEFVDGAAVFRGQKAYTREEARRHFREAAAMAAKPFIYLSAGVSIAQFTESLAIAGEAGADFSGVLCGRATWKDGIPVYARQGLKGLEEWLQRDGVRNIQAVNAGLQAACPWYAKLGISVAD